MKETSLNKWFENQQAPLIQALDPIARDRWNVARTCKIAQETATSGNAKHRPKKRKPVGRWAPGHRYMILSSVITVFEAGAKVSLECKSVSDLLEPAVIDELLKKGLPAASDRTKGILLRCLRSFAERILDIRVPWLLQVAIRVELRSPRKNNEARRQSYDIFVATALQLAPTMPEGTKHDVETALEARHAATFGIFVETASRRAEGANLLLSDIIIDRAKGRVTVVINAANSKAGVPQSRLLSREISRLVIDWVDNARPILLSAQKKNQKTDALWLGKDGYPLGTAGLMVTLRAKVAAILGHTVSCNILRQAMASRSDIPETVISDYLGQSRASKLANQLYAWRDIAGALQFMQEFWANLR